MSEKHTPMESNRSRRTILKALGVTAVGGLGMTGSAAASHGGNPQDSQSVECLANDCIRVNYDYRGLGGLNVQTVEITVEGAVEGTCTNPSGRRQPPGQNPATVTATSSESVADSGGRVVGSEEFCPDDTLEGLNPCPNVNWTFEPTGGLEFESATITLLNSDDEVVHSDTLAINC